MSQLAADKLECLLRANNVGWLIDRHAPKERALSSLREQLEEVSAEYRRRIGVEIPFTPESLAAEGERNPHKVRAFLQALGTTRSPEMLVMVWRILQGLSIRHVEMNYREQDVFSLVVALGRPGAAEIDPPYRSENINDAVLVRHFGITTMNGRPLFDGFFPLRKLP